MTYQNTVTKIEDDRGNLSFVEVIIYHSTLKDRT